jgi:ATP-binding cassette subfamily B protein/subfamily B ATP-binding cassette protein MsbA
MKKYSRLIRYVWPHRGSLALVLAGMLLQVGLNVLRPWPTKLLVDQGLDRQPLPGPLADALTILPGPGGVEGLLFWVCAATALIFLAGNLMTMASNLASLRLGQQMTYDLAADLFLHMQRLSLLFHSRRPVGDSLSRVTGDAYCVQNLVGEALLPLLQSTAMLAAMFFVAWQLEPTLTLLAMGVAPFLALVILLFRKPMRLRNRARRDLEGTMMSQVEQTLGAVPAVQAFTREDLEHERFRSCARATVVAYLRAGFLNACFGLAAGLATALGTAAVMWLGAHYVLEGRLTTGDLLVFLAYLGSLYGPLSTLIAAVSALQYGSANADRVLEVFDTPVDVCDAPGAREARIGGHVRYEGVTFEYDPGRPVLRDVSFEVQPGETVAVVGPTGGGKSTLISLLVRFFDPRSGRVLVDGHDLRDLRVRSLRRQVAVVLQEPFILPLSVAENIAYGDTGAGRERVQAAAAAAQADAFILRLSEGFDTVVGQRGATLSGGEKQRLAIARAFLKDAPILILDEPTSALDARTESELLEVLQYLMRGRTTFIVAHRLSTIRNADRILVLNQGELVEQGRHADLLAQGGLYATLYRQQTRAHRHGAEPQLLAE